MGAVKGGGGVSQEISTFNTVQEALFAVVVLCEVVALAIVIPAVLYVLDGTFTWKEMWDHLKEVE